MSNNMFQNNNRRSGALPTVLRILLLLIFIAAGAFLGVMGWNQFLSINAVNQAQTLRIDNIYDELLLPSDVDGAIRNQREIIDQQIIDLENEVAALIDENNDLKGALDVQADSLDTLESERQALAESVDDLQGNINNLFDASQALQTDITQNGTAVDDLGASFDNVNNQIVILRNKLNEVETSLEETEAFITNAALQEGENDSNEVGSDGNEVAAPEASVDAQFLNRWYLVHLITRTKIHIFEEDLALAEENLVKALNQAQALQSVETGAAAALLSDIEEEIQTAIDSLESKPAQSNQSLNNVLDLLEQLLVL